MKSISTIFKTGYGPSSSHTVGPTVAAKTVKDRYPNADYFEVSLFGSLSLTGKGHGTDKAIQSVLENCRIHFDTERNIETLPHPNTMEIRVYEKGQLLDDKVILSVGGGDIEILGESFKEKEIYKESTFLEILSLCEKEGITLPEYIYAREDESFKDDLLLKWHIMKQTIEKGLKSKGRLPGKLNLERKARMLYELHVDKEGPVTQEDRLLASYAYAVAEENAAGGQIVTCPTCGSAGVLPAVLYYMEKDRGYKEEEIIDGLAVAGLIGNLIRTNASLSGAECGCQAEIGSACSMAAAAKAQINHMNLKQIEYAAEVSMEHHLGLTCDPILGYVQIPCIERNAVAAMRAINAVNIARFLYLNRKISFDAVIETMYKTGKDILSKYRETGTGGLASLYKTDNK